MMQIKLQNILKRKYVRDYIDKNYTDWQAFLSAHKIEQKIMDLEGVQIFHEMIDLANRNDGSFVVIQDPDCDADENPDADHVSLLIVPKKLAEKVVVLQDIPEPE